MTKQSNIFGRMLEIIWLVVGIAGAIGSFNSFMHMDKRNGYMMALISLIGLLMFMVRRSIRLRKN
jgi:hypothetical protein